MRVPRPATSVVTVTTLLSVIALTLGQPEEAWAQPPGTDAVERVDYLTFAQGAMPVGIGGAGAKLGAVIEGHTSSGGAEGYNLELWERRAQAVVASLVGRGPVKGRVSAIGVGESRPIAPNTDENGRSLNRCVEIRCK